MSSRTGPLPPADLQRLAEALASGLLAARRKGLAHRHLTATNVLLADSKNDTGWAGAFITDFGLTAYPATASTGDAADLGFLLAAAAGIGAGERFNARNARIKLPGSDAFLAVLEQLTAPEARPFADDLAAYEAVDAAIIEWRDPSKRAAASRPAPRPLTPHVPQAPQPEASPHS